MATKSIVYLLIVIGAIGVFLLGLYPSIPAVRGAGSSSEVTVTVTATPAVVIDPGGVAAAAAEAEEAAA